MGWISSVFKAIRIGGKVASTVTSLAGLAKNIQVYINHNINAFEKILDELNEIHDEQETFLTSISPEVSIAINNQTAIIKKLIKEKSNLGSAVNFTTISSLYESAVDSALAIGFPLVGFVIPAAKKIYGFAKRRMAASSTAQVEVKTSTKLVDPPSKSRLGRYISGGVKQYQAKVTSIKLRLNQRFGRAAKIGKGIISGAKVAMSYFNAGLNIYMIIASHEACRAKQEEARKARDDLKQSLVHFEETERNLTIAKNVMEQSFQYLRGNITHESTLSVIADIKEMVEDMSGTSEDLVEVAVDIQHFLDNIKEDTSYKGTNRLEEQILTALKRIPFTLSCYTNKVKMLKYILNSCKKGKGSFDFLYDEARGYFDNDDEDNPDSPQNCARWTGYRYVNKEDLLKVWRDEAKKHNVKENCVLNDPAKKDTACSFKKDGYEAAEIGEKMKLTEVYSMHLFEKC
ncbi:hypothetical protein QZH41_011687 [Actinostola sp. cb2023]|nr:hypothetical protein QZH41_011687 [Actinostola sp. cb2023]